MEDGQLFYKKKRVDLLFWTRIDNEIHNIHEGSGDSSYSKAMSAHLVRNPTYEKISARFFGTEYTMTFQITFKSAMDAKKGEVCLPM